MKVLFHRYLTNSYDIAAFFSQVKVRHEYAEINLIVHITRLTDRKHGRSLLLSLVSILLQIVKIGLSHGYLGLSSRFGTSRLFRVS